MSEWKWKTISSSGRILRLTWVILLVQANEYNVGNSKNTDPYVAVAMDVPHQVLVVYGSLYCSGSLIRSKIVLTTAGCMTAGPLQRAYVKVGGSSITGLGQVIPVADVKIHEYFRYYSRMDNDIALLILKDHVNFNDRVKKVPLFYGKELEPGVSLDVTGWASQTLPQAYANMLLKSEMTILNREECMKTFNHLITPSNFCASFSPEFRLNDIGGPATHNHMLVGILSFGGLHDTDPQVVVFTNITYFNRWIVLNARRLLEKYCILPEDSSESNPSSLEIQKLNAG